MPKNQVEIEDPKEYFRVNYFHLMHETSTDIKAILDKEGSVLFVTPEITSSLGYEHDEFVGRNFLELIHESDVEEVKDIMKRAEKHPGHAFASQHHFKHRDGSWHILETRFRFHVDDEGREAVVLSARDITGVEEAKGEVLTLSKVVELVADGVIITNADGVIEYVNPAWSKMTGYSSEESVGKNPRFLKSGRHGKKFYERLWAALGKGKTFRAVFCNKRKDGKLYYEEQSIAPVEGPEGDIAHYISVAREITDKEKIPKELLKK